MRAERPWHRHYPEPVPTRPDFEEVTLPRALARTASRFRDRTALWFMGKEITFGELDALANRFAEGLRRLGVGPGDTVALLLPNIPQAVIAVYGAWRAGAVVAMNNPLYTERELAYQLADSEATLIVALDLLLDKVTRVLPETRIRRVVACHLNDYLPFPKKRLFPLVKKELYRAVRPDERTRLFTDLVDGAAGAPEDDRSRWEALGALLYTGGTTGTGKGVMLTHRNLSVNVQQLKAWFHDLEEGRGSILAVFPFFHSAGFTGIQNLSVWMGWTNVLVPRPEPDAIVDALKGAKPELVPGVPTLFVGLLANPRFRRMDLGHIRGFFAGAAPLSLETFRQMKELTGGEIVNLYGLTETAPMATATPWGGPNPPGTVGVPLPATDVKIVDVEDDTREMPVGEAGEVLLKGPQVMEGYFRRPEETAAVLKDGWLSTGDIGFLDGEGFLTLVDRKKDMIVASGYNVYPSEVDEVLHAHPDILEACTIGLPDAYRGETVQSFVVPKPRRKPSETEIVDFCRTRLAPYKVPKRIAFVDELPKSAVGKVLRRVLREDEARRQ